MQGERRILPRGCLGSGISLKSGRVCRRRLVIFVRFWPQDKSELQGVDLFVVGILVLDLKTQVDRRYVEPEKKNQHKF